MTAQGIRVAKGSARKAAASQTRYHWQLHDIPPHEKNIIKIRAYRAIFVRRRRLLVPRSTRRPGKPSAGANMRKPRTSAEFVLSDGATEGSRPPVSSPSMHVARGAATAATTRRRRRSLEPEPSATATPGRRVRPASPCARLPHTDDCTRRPPAGDHGGAVSSLDGSTGSSTGSRRRPRRAATARRRLPPRRPSWRER